MNLDFSEFHPLDHSLFFCSGYPGGKRRHMSYRWEFQWREVFYRHTMCHLRLHQWTLWYRGGQPQHTMCGCCGKKASLAQHKAKLVESRNSAFAAHASKKWPTEMVGDPHDMNWDA